MVRNKTSPSGVKDSELTAKRFREALNRSYLKTSSHAQLNSGGKPGKLLSIRMADIFELAKQFMQMPLQQVEALLDTDNHEARVGAVSIMDFQARDKKTTALRRQELYNLYISKHDRINTWDLVDRTAPYVVGGYLFDKDRKPLYKLAKSKNAWERRTAIVATYFFIRQNDIDDTFKIARLLVHDNDESVNKAVGSWVREAGKRDVQKLTEFLDTYAATMPRVTLRYAIEKLGKKDRERFMNAGK